MLCKEKIDYILYDCRSTDGVIVNGRKLVPEQGQQLVTGDKFIIGDYMLIFYNTQPAYQSNEQKEHALS
ncbi:hypothetical protein KDW_00300 [Dictyobacter vulcani]|uniref:FHA domain-containing protein n=1 Tax=Dictyobacter vulcani TaxID=2607529 RepID=A0A5J4KBH2_9CHLR|nr:hypothetical protein KDW_00300 [Dictyobacter vulcani]